MRLQRQWKLLWTVLLWAVEDGEPWDVSYQLGMEKESQYLKLLERK
jgi:hypothetical protein